MDPLHGRNYQTYTFHEVTSSTMQLGQDSLASQTCVPNETLLRGCRAKSTKSYIPGSGKTPHRLFARRYEDEKEATS
jgi:hypothetical protein